MSGARKQFCTLVEAQSGGVMKLVDIADLKSAGSQEPYGFESRPRYQGQAGASDDLRHRRNLVRIGSVVFAPSARKFE